LADASFAEEHHLDTGGNAPAFFAFEAKGSEGLGEGFAETEAIEEFEGHLLWGFGVKGFG